MSIDREPEVAPLAEFAEELRAWRKHAGLSSADLAAKINYSSSLIGMIEAGRRVPRPEFAEALDRAFGLPGSFKRLQKRLKGVWFPSSFMSFVPFEEQALALRTFEHSLIPGLLQTENYARAVLKTRPNTTEDAVEEMVKDRLSRQGILLRPNPPLLYALIDEGVLRRPVAPAEVMRDQLMHLVEASERPNITIQVVPYSAGGHSGLLGAFVLAEMDDSPSIAYLEDASDGRVGEERAMVTQVTVRFDALRSDALPQGASRGLIEKVAEEHGRHSEAELAETQLFG